MCSLKSDNKLQLMAPLPVKCAKLTCFLIVFLFAAECAAGSCLNYGHACWGAHGKRSGQKEEVAQQQENPLLLNSRWFLSRLITPLDHPTRFLSQDDASNDVNNNNNNHYYHRSAADYDDYLNRNRYLRRRLGLAILPALPARPANVPNDKDNNRDDLAKGHEVDFDESNALDQQQNNNDFLDSTSFLNSKVEKRDVKFPNN